MLYLISPTYHRRVEGAPVPAVPPDHPGVSVLPAVPSPPPPLPGSVPLRLPPAQERHLLLGPLTGGDRAESGDPGGLPLPLHHLTLQR